MSLNKKIIIISLVLACLLSITAVSASEITNETNDLTAIESYDSIVSDTDSGLLTANPDGTFTDLANEIAKAKDELNINRNYAYSEDDSDYKQGILIDKKITINGNGYTINGNNQARAFYITADSVTLNDISFVNCAVKSESSSTSSSISSCLGGAIYWQGSDGYLVNCNFVNSSSYSDSYCSNFSSGQSTSRSYGYSYSASRGGAVYWSGSNGRVLNCNFVNSTSYSTSYSHSSSYSYPNNGGTCYSYGSSTSYGISCGGAIYWDGSDGSLVKCSFVNSTSYSYSSSSSSVSSATTDSYLSSSSSSNSTCRGGAVYLNGDNTILTDCSFENSSSYTESYSKNYYSDPITSSSSESDSISRCEGGAVYVNSDNDSLTNCSFKKCSVNSSTGSSSGWSSGGGAVYLKGDNSILTDCRFVECTSDEFGGALDGVDGLVKNSVFIGNSAPSEGGGAIDWGGSAVNCTFINNYARYGGAILAGDVVNCTFINNSVSDDGGALCHVYAVNSTFTNNHARYGGAISGYSDAENCIFTDNSADVNGGAMHFSEGSAVNCTFTNNHAGSSGGAICSAYNDYHTNNIKNCIFTDNSAGENGGAVCVQYGECYAENCKFQNNHADSLGGAMYGGTGEGLIFKRNTAGEKGDNTYETELVKPILNVCDFTSTYKSGDKLIINFTTSKGTPITDADVTIDVYKNDALIGTYYCLSGDGWTVDLDVGNYVAVASVPDYEIDPANATVTVNKAKTKISTTTNNNELVATLTYGTNGKAISGASVKFSLNGETTTVKTNSKGQAKLSIAGLSSGTVTVSYAGNAKYKSSSTSIKIVPKTDIIISALYDSDANEIVATLKNGDTGKAVASTTVQFNINGATTTAKTNSKGQATISTATLPLGTNTATISYAGNSKYNSASTSIKFDVKTKVIVTDVYAYKDRIVAKLTNGATGKYIANANMIVEINGVKYNAKSDNKGQLTFNTTGLGLPDAYDLTISYRGNDRYTASSATVAVDLNKANMMITTNYHANKQKMVATLKNSKTGVVVRNANMIIDLNGVKTTYKSNDQGKITLPTADFAPGIYVGTVTYPGNARYNSISAAFKVDV